MRVSKIERKTNETDIKASLNVDGIGSSVIDTGCGFLDHMLTLFSKHGRFDIELSCKGDTNVDYHHSVEDCGIVLGKLFKDALGDLRGVKRYGSMILPMDEALILSAIDLSGRDMLCYDVQMSATKVGDFDVELAKEFFIAFTRNAEITLHIKKISGENSHHIIEGVFKCVARALNEATKIDKNFSNEIPSTKGILI